MSALVIDQKLKDRIAQVVMYAEQSDHWYRLDRMSMIPGENPKHRVHSGSLRMVFSWTARTVDEVYKHLSISTSTGDEDSFPPPVLAYTLAGMFGFTGGEPDEQGLIQKPADDWFSTPNGRDNCIVLVQLIT